VTRGAHATHDELARDWLGQLASRHTRDAYGRDLAAFVAWCEARGHAPLEVGVAEVDDYRDDCRLGGALPATVARRLSALASFYAYAVAARARASNPVDEVERPAARTGPAPAGLAERDALALLEAAFADGPKVSVLVALLLLEGLKLTEALALDVEDLDGSGWSMRATVARRAEDVALTLDGRTADAIASYLRGRASGPLLLGDSPRQPGEVRLTRFGADFLLKRAGTRAGIGRVSANTLRRTYITLSHRDGASVEDIARRVGHASPRDTRRFLS
jgi:integrase/recombinase XerD